MDYSNIRFEAEPDGVVVITINRPDKLNVLNNATMAELNHAFDRIEQDETLRGLIVTGAGSKAFVAGADINELTVATPLEGKARCLRDQRIMRRLETMSKPSIAAINGYALGGGLEMAMCCTLRIAVSTAKLALPEIKIGVFPANGGTQRLPRLIGRGRALEMMLTGALIDADEAYRVGLVNRVVESHELLNASQALMRQILANAPIAAACIMECVDMSERLGIEDGLQFEAASYAALSTSHDRVEGTRAFLEKRPPVFQGK